MWTWWGRRDEGCLFARHSGSEYRAERLKKIRIVKISLEAVIDRTTNAA
jgi:hypothetical protein